MRLGASPQTPQLGPAATPPRWFALAALALFCTLGGCSLQYRAPTLRVVDAEVTERTDAGVVIAFTVEGENPNSFELPLVHVNYALSLDGKRVFVGERLAEATLPSNGVQRVHLPAAIPTDRWSPAKATAETPYRLTATMVYLTPGTLAEILFDVGVRKPSVSLAASGALHVGDVFSAPVITTDKPSEARTTSDPEGSE